MKSYFQPQLKWQYQSISAYAAIGRLCNAQSSSYHYPIKSLFKWYDKFLNGGNLFTTPFNWIFGKIRFLKNCRHEFHFCQRKINYATFASAFFCWYEIIWVRKTVLKELICFKFLIYKIQIYLSLKVKEAANFKHIRE